LSDGRSRIGELLTGFRNAFFAGLLVVVPLGVSLWVIITAVGFVDEFIHVLPKTWQPAYWFGRDIPGLGLVLVVTLVFSVGVAMESLIGRRVVTAYESLLLRVPIASSIYNGVKQLMEQLFTSRRGFEAVVMLEWPRQGVWAVGFKTGSSWLAAQDGSTMINIFMPTTPNPTTGFYMIVRESQTIMTDMSVEQAFKLLMSAGIVAPDDIHLLGGRELPVHPALPDTFGHMGPRQPTAEE